MSPVDKGTLRPSSKILFGATSFSSGLLIGILTMHFAAKTRSPLAEADCMKLPTREGVILCLSQVSSEQTSQQALQSRFVSDSVLERLSIEECSFKKRDSQFLVSGVLVNGSIEAVQKVTLRLEFFKKGDDLERHAPMKVSSIFILPPIPGGKKHRFEQVIYDVLPKEIPGGEPDLQVMVERAEPA